LVNNIVLINNEEDFKKIPKNLKEDINTKIFALNIESHKILIKNNIPHEIADKIIKYSERLEIFDFSVRIIDWFKHEKLIKLFTFQGVNILSVLDSIEFQSLIVKFLLNYIIIKKIFERETPKKIFANTSFVESLEIIKKNLDVTIESWPEKNIDSALWDKISIKKNIGKIPLSFNISRKKYQKIKNLVEKTVCSSLNLWFNSEDVKKKTILFLEFNPEQYSELFSNLAKNKNFNIVCCNIRNPAFKDLAGSKVLRKFNIKILDYEKLISNSDREIISDSQHNFSKNLEEIFDDKLLFEIFSFQNISIWSIIREKILKILHERLLEYMKLIIISKKITQEMNIKSIVTLNEIGEIEKTVIDSNNKKIPIILLQHGYTDYNHETSRFDFLSGYSNIINKIAVWGETQKKYLVNERNLSPDKIFVTGSPRHDKFFNSKNQIKSGKKTLLLAPRPITEISAEDNTELHIRYEKILEKIYHIIKNNPNVELIIKLHPIQLGHNEELLEFFKILDPKVHVNLFSSVVDIIEQSDAVISISPENWDISTIVLESQILQKPTLNIFLNEKTFDFQCTTDNSVISITDKSDIEHAINEILFNEKIINDLKQNAKKHLKSYLVNHGNASKKFADILNS